MLSFGRPTGHFMTRETVEEQKPESASLWILHCNQYRPSSWARKIMSHKKIMIFISRMIITERKHKPRLSRMRITSLWVTAGRCESIRTPSDTSVLHCARVCATHQRLHWHPYRRSKISSVLPQRSRMRSNPLPGDHLRPLNTTQNADFTPCCIKRVT